MCIEGVYVLDISRACGYGTCTHVCGNVCLHVQRLEADVKCLSHSLFLQTESLDQWDWQLVSSSDPPVSVRTTYTHSLTHFLNMGAEDLNSDPHTEHTPASDCRFFCE